MPVGVPLLKSRSTNSLPRLTPAQSPGGVDDAAGDAWRGTASDRGYDSKWRTARLGFLRKHPLCVCCSANGRTSAAAVVDHIEPHKGDRALFWDRENWQPLCWGCHREIKARLETEWQAGRVGSDALRLNRLMPDFFVHP